MGDEVGETEARRGERIDYRSSCMDHPVLKE